jgi:uncharacterized membrane protein
MGRSVRYAATIGLIGMCLVAPAQAQLMPGAFENMAHIACVDQQVAIELLVVFEANIARGEASHSTCG